MWFKPTDKRVPLIAIPTEQAPRDFVENHQSYANTIFVAAIKRWPITSLHPFGTLLETLGPMGNIEVETKALLRDNNFPVDEFPDNVKKNLEFEDWTFESEDKEQLQTRKDFRDEFLFTIIAKPDDITDHAYHYKELEDGIVEFGFHVADTTPYLKPNTHLDREVRKRSSGVILKDCVAPILPDSYAKNIFCLRSGNERLTFSVVLKIDKATGQVKDDIWIGKSIVKPSVNVLFDDIDAALEGDSAKLEGPVKDAIPTLAVCNIRLQLYVPC